MVDQAPSLLTIYACLSASSGLLFLMYRWGRGKSTLFYLGAFFALFAFGPPVNYLLGNRIYFGITIEHLDVACIGFTVAIAGLAAADRLTMTSAGLGPQVAPASRHLLYPIVLAGLAAYGAITTARLLPLTFGTDKLGQVQAAGSLHSPYLVLELCAVSTYFIARRSRMFLVLWRCNLLSYIMYCLATSERDFLFVVFSVLLHRQMIRSDEGRSLRIVSISAGFVLAASLLFAGRAGERLDFAGVLNQGSIAFVDTFLIERVPSEIPLAQGQTYWQALTGLLPSSLYDSGSTDLSSWLVSLYAPGSPGGYGFSLSGEAYLNFGLPGIVLVFFVVGLVVRGVNKRFGVSDWGTYLSVYVTAVTMYAFRIDSAQLLKSALYGAIFFAVISGLGGDVRTGKATRRGGGRRNMLAPSV